MTNQQQREFINLFSLFVVLVVYILLVCLYNLSHSVAVSAGDALRDGYKLKGYAKVNNGNLSYWKKGSTT